MYCFTDNKTWTYTNTLPLFILDFILRIFSKPSNVKWAPLFIDSAALQKSLKSNDFTPKIGYLLKKGIILL